MGSVLVLYHSQEHGNTHAMAEAIAEGAKGAGADVTVLNTNEKRLDIDEYRKFDAVAFGTPDYYSYMAGQVKVFYDRVFHVRERLKGKPGAVFITHGGGGKAMESMVKLSGSVNLELVDEGLSIKKSPSGEAEAACRDLGRKLAEAAAG